MRHVIDHRFPVCLCKHGETADVTRMCDTVRIHLCLSCRGIRIEAL